MLREVGTANVRWATLASPFRMVGLERLNP